MTREQVKTILPEITEEQLKLLLDENSKDIGKAKKDYEDVKKSLGEAEQKLKEAGDVDGLRKELEELKKADSERKEADEKARTEKEADERFSKAAGNVKFLNDYTRNGIKAEFLKALSEDDNKGKNDTDIYSALTKDRDGLYVNPNPPDMTGAKSISSDVIDDTEARRIMGLPIDNRK